MKRVDAFLESFEVPEGGLESVREAEVGSDAFGGSEVGLSGVRKGDLKGLCRASLRRRFLNARGVSIFKNSKECSYGFFLGIARV